MSIITGLSVNSMQISYVNWLLTIVKNCVS